jgi:hypothetical protein
MKAVEVSHFVHYPPAHKEEQMWSPGKGHTIFEKCQEEKKRGLELEMKFLNKTLEFKIY